MSLRTRLIVAFFALSVIPLGLVTAYAYRTNVDALKDAAAREADVLASELSQRMQLVTAQLSERVEHMMDMAELQAELERQAEAPTQVVTVEPAASATEQLTSRVAYSLGEAAMLLNNIEVFGMRFGGPGRGGSDRASVDRGTRPPPPGSPPAPRSGQPPSSSRSPRQSPQTGSTPRTPAVTAAPGTAAVPETKPALPPAPVGAPPPPPAPPGAPPVPEVPKLRVDLQPMRREMYRQLLGDQSLQSLTPEQRQRVAEEVNQRMLGIVQGFKLGAVELQKQADEAARQSADAQSRAAAAIAAGAANSVSGAAAPGTAAGTKPAATKPAATKPAAPAPAASGPAPSRSRTSNATKKSSITGSKLDVKLERDGEVVRHVNAELNLPNLLQTVFTTSRDGNEVPFAVAQDGRIFTRTDADRTRVESFGSIATPGGPASVRLSDWIVVTTQDPSGSGLRLGIARPLGDSLANLRRATARNAGFGLLFIALALVGIVPISTRLTRHLTTLGDAARRIAQGDYSARVPVKTKDEVGRLAVAFNQMAADVEKHQTAAIEQERIKRELELGRQIQSEMLPHAPLKLGLTEIKGVSVPAREVGGDFFNYFEIGPGAPGTPREIALLVGDVSGKGVGAALLMANIQASLRTRLALGQDLSALADQIDRDIEANSPGPVYATLFVGILDPVTRTLRYLNAGHHPQYILHKGGSLERMASSGLPVGLVAGRGHKEHRVQLEAGDVLFFYTDGCVEAENEQDDMFGAERLESLLVSFATDGKGDVLERVESAINGFRGKREPFDDATMMAVRVG